MKNLDWDDLRVFLEAARVGSVTKAARALAIDHSTVSRRLTRLEYAVGGALFERTRDGLTLTQRGILVLRRAEEIAGGIGSLGGELTGDGTAAGIVRLATMEGIASLFLASRAGSLRQAHPRLQLELVTSPQTVRITRREADLFLSFFRPPGRGLASERIGSFATGIHASPAYLESRGTPSTPDDLGSHACVGYIEDLLQVDAVRWLEELVPAPSLVFTSNSMIAQMEAARGGLGLVVLPAFAVRPGSGLVPVMPGLTGRRELWLTTHPDLAAVARVKAVRAWLRDLIAADPVFSSS